jgi:hypothetical protein
VDTVATWVTVPVGEREQYLPGLLAGLQDFKGRIVFVNNHRGYTRFDGVHHVEDFGPINIYRWWNVGINYAQRDGAEYVAVLNDDVEFDNGFIPSMLNHLIRHDLAIVDMDNSGNGGGAAWIMDLKYGMRLDERYRWWYGDTELFDRAKAQGRFGKFTYPGFGHLNPNGNLTTNPELMELVRQDTDLYRETYAG